MKQRFELGQVVATPGAIEAMKEHGTSATELLNRHLSGDWGDVPDEDKQANEDAVLHGDRILSSYALDGDVKVWVITERDRSSTCILLPEEY